MLTGEGAAQARDLAAGVERAAREAGALALGFFRASAPTSARIWQKAGNSPVTEADMAVDALLRQRLSALAPDFHWLSEEAEPTPHGGDRPVWIVDPIDGTRAFAAGEAQWGVSIALVMQGVPVIGCFFMPARAALYRAQRGEGAFCNDLRLDPDHASRRAAGPHPVLDSLLSLDPTLEAHPKIPSLAARIAYVADGQLRFGIASIGAHEWDIAAADLLLREAGGQLTDLTGQPVRYTGEARKLPVLIGSRSGNHAIIAGELGAVLKNPAGTSPSMTNSPLANGPRS